MNVVVRMVSRIWVACICLIVTSHAEHASQSTSNTPSPDGQDFKGKHSRQRHPHILFILADDYGWNDVGYHGSEIRTPTLDELSAQGVRLENHYVYPLCTPTRSALLTGRYTIHTGFQNSVGEPGRPKSLPRDQPTLPEHLRDLGYATHMVGKWHLGYTTWGDTPTGRGFQSHLGVYQGIADFYNHTNCDGPNNTAVCGYDFFRDRQVDWSAFGTYATDIYKDRVAEILHHHDPGQPLFLYVAFQLTHSPMQVPRQYLEDYKFIKDKVRQIYAGMASYMDQTVADIKESFEKQDMWDDTLLIFSSDNGGSPDWGGRNDPLRGEKGDHWQGGIRAVSFVHGYNIDTPAATSDALLHITDWYPTLVHLAGGSTEHLQLDGYDIWQTISQGAPSPRSEVLVNIDPLGPPRGNRMYHDTFDTRVKAAIIQGKWKLMTGQKDKDGPYPGYMWHDLNSGTTSTYRVGHCNPDPCYGPCDNVWLTDLETDPHEEHNLVHTKPQIVRHLLDRLVFYNSTAVTPQDPDFDPRSLPELNNGVWAPWL